MSTNVNEAILTELKIISRLLVRKDSEFCGLVSEQFNTQASIPPNHNGGVDRLADEVLDNMRAEINGAKEKAA